MLGFARNHLINGSEECIAEGIYETDGFDLIALMTRRYAPTNERTVTIENEPANDEEFAKC